jgi:dienelactone hydrolase
MKMILFFSLSVLFACTALANAGLRTETVKYTHDGYALEGYLAYDDSLKGKRPGVLVVHEWWGLNDYIRSRTEQLARMGYVAFAIDMTDALWQINVYSGAVHSFTNPASGNDPSKGVAYNELADKSSWEAMKLFFAEIFK